LPKAARAKKHEVAPGYRRGAVLISIDLSILVGEAVIYDACADAIRKGVAHVPDASSCSLHWFGSRSSPCRTTITSGCKACIAPGLGKRTSLLSDRIDTDIGPRSNFYRGFCCVTW
jgi:hypothetical protein